jgi:aminopeptidase
MSGRFTRLAELSVHGANVQEGQIVLVGAEIGLEEQARATAEAAYKRGAKFVECAEQNGARINLRGVTAPNLMDGLDKALLGKDALPVVKEVFTVISERSTNWCFVPAPHPAWAALVHPGLPADEAYEQLWCELEHVLRLDEPDPLAAWDERMAVLNDYTTRLTERRFDAIELRGPGPELTIGLLPTATWATVDFSTATGLRHFAGLPSEEVSRRRTPVARTDRSPRRSRSSSATGRSSAGSLFALKMALP